MKVYCLYSNGKLSKHVQLVLYFQKNRLVEFTYFYIGILREGDTTMKTLYSIQIVN